MSRVLQFVMGAFRVGLCEGRHFLSRECESSAVFGFGCFEEMVGFGGGWIGFGGEVRVVLDVYTVHARDMTGCRWRHM